MSKLEEIRKIAKKKNIKGLIEPSTRKGKKFMITLESGKKIHFGADGMQDHIDHRDEKRRNNFHNRFRNNKGYNDPNSGLYYSQKLLW